MVQMLWVVESCYRRKGSGWHATVGIFHSKKEALADAERNKAAALKNGNRLLRVMEYVPAFPSALIL